MCGASSATARITPPRSDRPPWVVPAPHTIFLSIDDQLGALELAPQAHIVPRELQHLPG
jgi:hypothetical protein